MNNNYAAQYTAYHSTYLEKIEPLTALCGAHAIHSVLGEEWYAQFQQQESKLGTSATVENDQITIFKTDFQAIIKIFRYREDESFLHECQNPITVENVFDAFQLPRKDARTKKGVSPFNALCVKLIADRNWVHHLPLDVVSASDESEIKETIYHLQQACNNCVKFLSYFKTVTNEDGASYFDLVYQTIKYLEETYKNIQYQTQEVIREENLGITPEQFNNICRDLYITTSHSKGVYYFESSNYAADIRAIRAVALSQRSKKSNGILILTACISVMIVVICLVLFLAGGRDNEKDQTPSPSASQAIGVVTTDVAESTTEATTTTTEAPPAREKITGSALYGGLEFRIYQYPSNMITVTVENTDTCGYTIGWVIDPTVVIKTTAGDEIITMSDARVAAGSLIQLQLVLSKELTGDIQSIKIQSIRPLGEDNLPLSGVAEGTVTIPITYEK